MPATTQRKMRSWEIYFGILVSFGVIIPAIVFLYLGYAASWSITDKNQGQIVNITAGFLTVDGLLLGFKTRLRNAFGTGKIGVMRANAIEGLQMGVLTLSLFWSLNAMLYAAFSTDLGLVSAWFRSAVFVFYVAVVLYSSFAILSRKYTPPQTSS